ncbi:Rpp20 subunit of nuclear RNase MRP and P-domain-containing protein [Aspergillus californicus]
MAQTTKDQKQKLQFERKNDDMVKLPKYAKVSKRPIPHPPVSSPYAGPSVPKTIYISTSTPYMSAVKRVQKLLQHSEKRATASVGTSANNKPRSTQQQQQDLLAALARGEEREQLSKEEVFVKATGRAMNTALKVGRWFESSGREAEYKVRVRTGSVLVVDDVEEDESDKERAMKEMERAIKQTKPGDEAEGGKTGDETITTAADTTIISDKGKAGGSETTTTATTAADTTLPSDKDNSNSKNSSPATSASASITAPQATSKPISKSALKKRKRAASVAASLAETELPESRTRWVNSVEVAISLK